MTNIEKVIKEKLSNYTEDDYDLVHNTIDMLCNKGVANGAYQDMTVLIDILEILSAFEIDIKRGIKQ